jgi:AraC-like DNA-binding protein
MIHYSDDRPAWTEERKVLTRSQLNIPGLHMMGCADFRSTCAALEPHYHHYMEFVAVIKGRQQYAVGEHKYTLHGGEVFLTFPNEAHGNAGWPQEICEFVWFQIDCAPDGFLGLSHPYSDYLYKQLCEYRERITCVSQEDLQKLRKAFYLLSEEDMHSHLLGHSLFLEFVVGNFTGKPGKGVESTDAEAHGVEIAERNSAISAALTYIHAHLTENPSLERIADHCGLSASRFNEAFKEQMGITPHAYITNLKIDTAKILLKNPEISVTDVAMQLNFSSGNHFSAVFKRYTGCTPSQYRGQS